MMRGQRCAPALVLLLCGCRGVQSALDPQGPRAADIAALGWVLFFMGAIVLLVVVAATWFAMRSPASVRAVLSSERAVYLGGIVFPAVVLTALLAYGLSLMRAGMLEASESEPLRISVIGEQWWWRVEYLGAGARIAAANEIRIPAGQAVEFSLGASDVIHSFWIPSLGGKVDMIPGRTTSLRLSADRPGMYRGQCAEYCGGPHALMALPVQAMPEAEYAEWLRRQAAPAAEPASNEAKAGKALFIASGCGACHSVRGTEATGSIGPDLTHIGSRPSVGVDTLPLTQINLARFIAEGQHIKPGNRMPPFRIFSETELAPLSAYLVGLR
jgi:cytochrome c oxidase subunit 2